MPTDSFWNTTSMTRITVKTTNSSNVLNFFEHIEKFSRFFFSKFSSNENRKNSNCLLLWRPIEWPVVYKLSMGECTMLNICISWFLFRLKSFPVIIILVVFFPISYSDSIFLSFICLIRFLSHSHFLSFLSVFCICICVILLLSFRALFHIYEWVHMTKIETYEIRAYCIHIRTIIVGNKLKGRLACFRLIELNRLTMMIFSAFDQQ